jgi:dephospho-CoA kinase
MKILAVSGTPGVGKTTLFRAVIDRLGKEGQKMMQSGLVVYHEWTDQRLIILGDYRKRGFGGTDRLSMAVQPQAIEFLRSRAGDDIIVLFEGDRLFNQSFLTEIQKFSKVKLWVLTADENIRRSRCEKRGSNQNEKWLKGRESKIKNLNEVFNNIKKFRHETPEDTDCLVDKICSTILGQNLV